MNLWTVPIGATPPYECWPSWGSSVVFPLTSVTWSNPPVRDAHTYGVAGDGMSDDSKLLARFLEDALGSPGSWVRIRRGIYRVDADIELFVGGGFEVPAGEIAKSTDADATYTTDPHHPCDATPSARET